MSKFVPAQSPWRAGYIYKDAPHYKVRQHRWMCVREKPFAWAVKRNPTCDWDGPNTYGDLPSMPSQWCERPPTTDEKLVFVKMLLRVAHGVEP